MAELPENDRQTGPFLATAGQVDFPADFPLIDAPGDETGSCVYLERERGSVRTSLALGDFTVPSVAENGFTARLVVPALAGDRYWIVGRQRQARLRAHPLNGAVRTPTLEGDAREAAARSQEASRDADRALSAPIGESLGELPVAAARANGIMLFDANGAPIVQPTPVAWNEIGGDFQDDGPWSGPTAPLTHDDGVFG